MMHDGDRDPSMHRDRIRDRNRERLHDRELPDNDWMNDRRADRRPARYDCYDVRPDFPQSSPRDYDRDMDAGRHNRNHYDRFDRSPVELRPFNQYNDDYMKAPYEGPSGHFEPGPYNGPSRFSSQPDNYGAPPGHEVLRFAHFVLVPPPADESKRAVRERRPTRARPPGCRTIFVGGVPDTASEDMLGQLFETCGGIFSIRLSKKNFAHIRFEDEACVDRAMYYSGWRMKVDDKDDWANTGRLHVDFAEARDDQYEWECKQWALKQAEGVEQPQSTEVQTSSSLPPVVPYSDREAVALSESLKGDGTFSQAASVLVNWLERGSCNQHTANRFYDMAQLVSTHIRRLTTEWQTRKAEFQRVQQMYQDHWDSLMKQTDDVEKVFISASKQKAWDHFSKAQRKNLTTWKSQAQEAKRAQTEQAIKERQEDNMELSDGEGDDSDAPGKKKVRREPDEVNELKDERDSLKCQVEAYRNELDLQRMESSASLTRKDAELKVLQQALQGAQRQLMRFVRESGGGEHPSSADTGRSSPDTASGHAEQSITGAEGASVSDPSRPASSVTMAGSGSDVLSAAATDYRLRASAGDGLLTDIKGRQLSDDCAQLLGILSLFLHVHPYGASVEQIQAYLRDVGYSAQLDDLEDVLLRFPRLFRSESQDSAASAVEKRWCFIGLPQQHM